MPTKLYRSKKLYAVRHADDKQAVGFFWVNDIEDLVVEVDSISEVERCEFQEISGSAAFVWDGDCPALGIERDEAAFEDDYRKLMHSIEPDGEFLRYFYDDAGDDWMRLQLFIGDVRPRLIPKIQKPVKPTPLPKPAPKPATALVSYPHLNNVYFIQCGDHIKIGVTGSVQKRLKALATAHHQELTLLAVIENAPGDLEFSLHNRFAALRVKGEWFRAEPELLAYIEEIKNR